MNTKKEKLLYATYQSFMDQGLGRTKPDTLKDIVADEVMGFGTTADEKIFGVDAFLKLIRIQKEQSEGLDMTWKIEPVSRYVNDEENLAAFADDIHLNIDADGENIEMYLRFSIILGYTNNKWLVIHWHGSKPENVQSEEDTFGIENWKHKVEKLEIIVAERTADLVEKNRELEIETSLERVRARSMAMHITSELQAVINTVHTEFIHLNIASNGGSFIAINNDITTELRCWGSGGTTETSEELHLPPYEKPFCTNLINRIKSSPGFFTEEYTQKEKKEFFTFLFKHEPWSRLDSRQKKEILSAPGGYTRSCCVSQHTSIFIINHFGEKFSDDDNDILQRFAKVFEQTYTRFLDLQKAEAQAREAHVQLAMERVRARTMAMQKSDELTDVAALMFRQVSDLGIKTWTTGFNVWSDDNNFYTDYVTNPKGGFMEPFTIDATIMPVSIELRNAKIRGEEFYVNYEEGEALAEVYRQLGKFGENQFKGVLESGFQFPSSQYEHFVFGSKVSLMFITYEPVPEAHNIFKRFAKVFEQTYTRFLDLQKAEAQAREAQIELGLERVRAKAMAMQSSSELAELVDTLFKELTKLDILLDRCIIMLYDAATNDSTWWIAAPETEALPISIVVKFHDYAPYLAYIDAWQKRILKWRYVLEGTTKKEWDNYIFSETEMAMLPTAVKDSMKSFDRIFLNVSFNNFGSLTASTSEALPEEKFEKLLRFAKVFDSTYTRFNDLQKAEAQAREAQIELALERVRARTMAMQKSEELPDTSYLLFQQLKELGASADQLSIGILNEAAQTMDLSVTLHGSQLQKTYTVKLDEPFVVSKSYAAWKANKKSIVITLTGKDLEDYNAYRNSLSKIKFNKTDADNKWVVNCAFFSKGWMSFSSLENVPAETIKLLERFTAVFDGTYTRFLDLQKAEAQAREAQIETALERVRSRTMGMQKSEELKEVIQIVYDQFIHLNINVEHTGFILDYKQRDDMHIWLADRNKIQNEITFPYFDSPHWNSFIHAKKNGLEFFDNQLNFQEKNIFYHALFKIIPELPKEVKDYYFNCEALAISTVLIDNVGLYIENFKGIPYTNEENNILLRFGKVFQQTYTRFLDLQKAEAQAREAQIELALERVRARTMAMQKSEELPEISSLLFKQVKELGVTAIQNSIGIVNEETGFVELSTTIHGSHLLHTLNVPINETYVMTKAVTAWKAKRKSLTLEFEGQELKNYDELRNSFLETKVSFPEDHWIVNISFFSKGWLSFSTDKNVSGEIIGVLKRFAAVFEQTYTRFLDLQKAEAQAREAQIEVSLEKIRSRSLAMHRSDELKDVIAIMFEKLNELNVLLGTVGIWLFNKATMDSIFWVGNDLQQPSMISLPYDAQLMEENTNYRDSWQACISGEGYINKRYTAEQKNRYFNYVFAYNNVDVIPAPVREIIMQAPVHIASLIVEKNSSLFFDSWQEQTYSETSIEVFKKVSKVFEQAYIRFLDLQKAEAQAREAQIELALERVRARTMSMQKSDELADAAQLLYQEFGTLGINTFSCGYMFIDEEMKTQTGWFVLPDGVLVPNFVVFPLTGDHVLDKRYKDWQKKIPLHIYEIQGEVNREHHQFLSDYVPSFVVQDMFSKMPEHLVFHCANFSVGYLLILATEFLSLQEQQTIIRFAKVFEMTYTRFLDLQKAEAQARESEIELALERVRARTMAMQHSDELAETAAILFQQFSTLGNAPERLNIGIVKEDEDLIEFWSTEQGGKQISHVFKADIKEPTTTSKVYRAWKNQQKSLVIDLSGNELTEWLKYLQQLDMPIKEELINEHRIHSASFFLQGVILMSTPVPLPIATIKLLERFSNVFEQTYTRFLDLQKAEAQAREAQIEAALEKVRSRTLAMQKSDELADTSIVIFEQLINLGIEPNRLFIGIIKEKTHSIEAWATNEDGTKIDNHFTLHTGKNVSVNKMYEGWKNKKKSTTIDMQGEELQDYFHYLTDEMQIPFQDGLTQKRRVQTIAYFGQGLIGMASPDEQPEATTLLLERFAAVFNLTYTRFNDLKIAEAHSVQAEKDLVQITNAKQSAEAALVELQATQRQLIQSEKMASLGELTAGIAHEIQNPLNFVNNFSEVSKELLDEMRDEMAKGNMEEVKEIMNDIIQNLEKINHHGKRADGIVKGMLQHSNTGSSKKEPTDINALCDEYLRLSYLGLRAKDKNFNAELITDFDKSIGKINIIPQDIGRVVLNLINNAFYAVDERNRTVNSTNFKARQAGPAYRTGRLVEAGLVYEPTVSISTKKMGDKVEIKVSDNGNGIPDAVKEKIFQPFFTTKPTGQGTGLGLSLSYDIIKAHGGEIKVETVENEGTTFIIKLPNIK